MKPKSTMIAIGAVAMLGAGCKKVEPSAAPAPTAVAPLVAQVKAPAPTPTPQPGQPPETPPTTQPSSKPTKPVMPGTLESGGPHTFGRAIAKPGSTPLATVLADPTAFSGKEVIVSAKVRTVCQRKGCWMEIAANMDKAARGARITFKDYGFFVPRDATGADARLEGTVALKKIAKAEVDHLESEGGRFANKDAQGNAHEVRFVATGVELTRR